MTDIFSLEKRSQIMSAVKSRGHKSTEARLIGLLGEIEVTGWRRDLRIVGRHDFTFPKRRIAIFDDGSLWHGCPAHGQIPHANRDYWSRKLERNKARDRCVSEALVKKGWRVVRFWEHETGNEKSHANSP